MPNSMGGAKIICACRWHMQYTRGIRRKECKWGQLAELQIDSITMRKDILIAQNKKDHTEQGGKEFNHRLLADVDERLGVLEKKTPASPRSL